MKTNITAMLLGAVLLALVGCMDFGASRLLIEAIDNETSGYKAVPIPQKTIYGTDIPIPAKEVHIGHINELYGYRWGAYSGKPTNISDVVYYVSESGTKPLKVLIYDYTEIEARRIEGTPHVGWRILSESCHHTSAIFDGHHQQDDDWVRTRCHYAYVIFDDKLIITFFTLHPLGGFLDGVVAQNVYTLPAEHLSNGVAIAWDTYNDEYAIEFDAPEYLQWGDQGERFVAAKKSDVKGFEVYHPTDENFPIRIELDIVMSQNLLERHQYQRVFRWERRDNAIIFQLFPNLYVGNVVDRNIFDGVEPIGEWKYEIPPQYHGLDLYVGVGTSYQ